MLSRMFQRAWSSTSFKPTATAAGDAGLQPGRGTRNKARSRLPQGRGQGLERAVSTSSAAAAARPAPAQVSDQPTDVANSQQRSISVLNRYRALLLDSTYRPVGVANWQRAICLDLMDKADVLEYYEQSVRSVTLEYYLPAVLRVRRHRSRGGAATQTVTLNRANIMLRDSYSCQYCGSSKELTIDHVVPQSKGGGNTWQNLVACCSSCNSKKGSKTLEQLRWKLRQMPKEPSMHEMEFMLSMILGSTNQEQLPPEWQAYIVPFTRPKKKQHHSS